MGVTAPQCCSGVKLCKLILQMTLHNAWTDGENDIHTIYDIYHQNSHYISCKLSNTNMIIV